ncbi:MarR family transcriptional regulator [Erysipelotrichaceae bacterium HCN-30851]
MNIETMMNYFSQIRKYYANILNEYMKDVKLSSNEISILIMLSNNQSITTSAQLYVLLGVSKGLVSRSVEHLISSGYLLSKRDEDDRRIVHLYLSEEGQQIVCRINKEVTKINEKLLADISEEEIEQMEKTMTKIIDRFKL